MTRNLLLFLALALLTYLAVTNSPPGQSGDSATPPSTQFRDLVHGPDTYRVRAVRDTLVTDVSVINSVEVMVDNRPHRLLLIGGGRPTLVMQEIGPDGLLMDDTYTVVENEDIWNLLVGPGTVFVRKDDSPPPTTKSM
ncbi:hypothetical protein [Lewinella sp. JB7]|uniref:hypothetical protein n=1 Tax=Lewinella sp. JB7 TaxID=2962887 RepID=UPI0020C9E9A2|nr:hypothetical protein [Lewinella sp. JB7]MCP9236635.1 hypothetical protein [Lewinella sp. JB7]